MKSISLIEAQKRLESIGLYLTENRFLYYTRDVSHCFEIEIDVNLKSSEVIPLVDYLLPTWEDFSFSGGLFIVRKRGIWGDYSEKVAERLYKKITRTSTDSLLFADSECQLLDSNEVYDMHTLFLIPLLFGWDAFVVPLEKDYFVFVCHDGLVSIVCKTEIEKQQVARRISDWSPELDMHWYHNRLL